ncbi:hypothetical protein CWC17_18950 [Pseudoalteromonas sp. S3785]|uniref:hypothetical protein n=1 Tax=Pseudoalteromonas sp. S3785 TaxID=579545 RepID=UPI00110C0800|nr:hypothetical protein [Pseudoalteromonas sp. S3785]TMO69727.1 hypothetical protein CWC17_18950 [Pseudoalteromonas sp. S3785]
MLPATVTLPVLALALLIESESFSTSVSLFNTSIFVVTASSKIVAVSGLATGASLTGVTVIVRDSKSYV